ncbi:methyltransferase domain-containing protein [Rhodococcus sp. G-MC3]|uniref:class I SAM-dependent methyltransferase n=1 Tax=Rhodococcus sp. G-MC3 TaxID=3046209 RepID=UPI0024B8AE17|nr:methyltransferase domain-containing protein [Rhodococcus sp. G-MC3]MDJ0392650.1 methyltransferase domain-containing protein [Rhodococcus sp. G-MC3]
MNSPLVAAIYEGPWRQGGALLATGLTRNAELDRASTALHLAGSDRLLDVACGPGNFTKFLGEQLGTEGLAVGLDFSTPMLAKAIADNSGAQVGYIRGDARSLPFDDESFDAACCFAALYLVPEPFAVVDEMIRVLKPGGRFALMTSCFRGPTTVRRISGVAGRLIGLRGFHRDELTSVLSDAGFHDIEQEVRGMSQFISARKNIR